MVIKIQSMLYQTFQSKLIVSLTNICCLSLGLLAYTEQPSWSQAKTPSWTHLSTEQEDLPLPGTSKEQTASLVLDIDRDGLNDFVVGSRQQGTSLVWYRRNAEGWEKYPIENQTLPIEAGGAFEDIDGDGDLDLLFGADWTNKQLWWWENPYPNYQPNTPWQRYEIKNSGANQHHDQIFGDFDDDGQAELVFWNQWANQLFIANIPQEPQNAESWNYDPIYRSTSGSEGLAKADIDGDGKLDIIGGGAWFKHHGGKIFTPNFIDSEQKFTRAAVGQLKPGGYPEVVFVVGDGRGLLKWYEWTGSSWVGQDLLGFEVDHGHSLEVVDIDGDGNLDIFCAEMRLDGGNSDAKMWIFYGDGQGNFAIEEIAIGFGNHESRVADLDGDGDLDILGKPYNWQTPRIDIWLQKNQ